MNTYGTSMWFFSRVSSHVNQEHILCFERLFASHTVGPLADKLFLAVPKWQSIQQNINTINYHGAFVCVWGLFSSGRFGGETSSCSLFKCVLETIIMVWFLPTTLQFLLCLAMRG